MAEFHQSSALRKFKLVLAGGDLWINAHWMAELSPYFQQLCFGENFSESKSGSVLIEDVEFQDVVAMLEYLTPDNNFQLRKKIGDKNLPALIHCSHRFQIPSMQAEVEQWVQNDLKSPECNLKAETLVEAAIEAELANFRESTVTSLYEKLGTTQTSKAIQNAIKDLPPVLSKKIIDETSKYNMSIKMGPGRPPIPYHWNDFDMRMFF
ncbi:hypothetical protein WR25_02424 [Diploscapter pachys]|uniref:BTB domain-containing protein n=1 Tax=Diploscapter pachys TaxID=2018661 RepID=A0A2A2KKN7_9BILA|nr:hypothetical protein WR25_02424 [Diploscapter pachys]